MPYTKLSAFQAFDEKATDCATLLEHLTKVLATCRKEAEADPANWGHAGSMGQVRSNLIETLAFIGGLEEQDITATLAELRQDT